MMEIVEQLHIAFIKFHADRLRDLIKRSDENPTVFSKTGIIEPNDSPLQLNVSAHSSVPVDRKTEVKSTETRPKELVSEGADNNSPPKDESRVPSSEEQNAGTVREPTVPVEPEV